MTGGLSVVEMLALACRLVRPATETTHTART